MSNFIALCKNTEKEECFFLKRENMYVLLFVLEVSGLKLAKTKQERDMILFLMKTKQLMIKKEKAGFDICDMPWQKEIFENQKHFMLSILEGVEKKLGWEALEYDIKEPILFFLLSKVRCLFQKITWDMIK